MLNSEITYLSSFKKASGWDKQRFTPFKITFYLSSPVSLTYPWIFFDSIITHLLSLTVLKRNLFVADKKINLSQYIPKGTGKPFASVFDEKSGLTVAEASVGIFHPEPKYMYETIYKRFEERFAPFKNKVRTNSGKFRQYAIKHIYVPSNRVTFYVRGDVCFIHELIKNNLFAIGSETRIGYGFIKNFSIEKTDRNYSIVSSGLAMRPIPVEFCEDYEDAALIAYRPPYWSRQNVKLCVVPFTPCRLKEKWRKYYG